MLEWEKTDLVYTLQQNHVGRVYYSAGAKMAFLLIYVKTGFIGGE